MSTPSQDPRPVPAPDPTTQFYWAGASARRLLLQRCQSCARTQFPPETCCLACQSTDFDHVEASGRGTIYSHALVERPFHQGFLDAVPYMVVLVELDDHPGVRIATNLLGWAPGDAVSIGLPVEIDFEERGPVALPQFRPPESVR